MKKHKTIDNVRERESSKIDFICDEKIIGNHKNINIIKNRDRILCKTAKRQAVCVT